MSEVTNMCQHRTGGRNDKANMPHGPIHKSLRESHDCSSRWTCLMTCLKPCIFFQAIIYRFEAIQGTEQRKRRVFSSFWTNRTCKTLEVWEIYRVVIFNIIYTDRKY